jgi:trans-aconitate methyltransferase
MMKSEAALLERIAREYREPDPGRKVDQKITAWAVDRILPWITGPEVLELGFGDDNWTGKIIDRFGHSHIVDASNVLLADAKEKYGTRLEVYHSLFEDFKPDKQFDGIVASYVLEHVADPVQVLGLARTWLNPKGHVLIMVPHADSLHRRLAVAMGMQSATTDLGPTDRQLGHRRVYTIERMQEDIAAAGLRIVERRGTFVKLLPQGMMTQFSEAMLLGFMKLGDELPMEYASSIAFDCVKKA